MDTSTSVVQVKTFAELKYDSLLTLLVSHVFSNLTP